MEGKWCYSFNGESFEGNFETRQEAIVEALTMHDEDERDEKSFFIGQTKSVNTSVDVCWLLDTLSEQAYEQAGEYAEGYLDDVKSEHFAVLEERMNEVLSHWMEEYKYSPHFWTVTNIQEISQFTEL